MDKCTYKKEGEADSKYCFATGDLQTECKDTAGSPPATAAAPAAPTTASPGGAATPASAGGAATPASGGGGTKVTWALKTSPFPQLPKYTTVFGASVFAVSSVTDAQFQHVASVLAEWLDNDEDGCVDNPL